MFWEYINVGCEFFVNIYSCVIFRILFILMSVSVIIYKIGDKCVVKDIYKIKMNYYL